MLKKYQKDIIEIFLISLLWLAPAARGGYDYRMYISFVLFIVASLVIAFINKKIVAFVLASTALIIACFIYERCFFTIVAPVVMLYTNKFYLKEEKCNKKNYDNINLILTAVVILFIIQTILTFIETPSSFKIVWNTKLLYYFVMFFTVTLVPFIMSYCKSNIKYKNELYVFRSVCLVSFFGILVTMYNYLLYKGFNDCYFYSFIMYPWFIFVYVFIKGSRIYKVIFFEKAEKKICAFSKNKYCNPESK